MQEKNEVSGQKDVVRIKPELVVREKVFIPDPSENIFKEFVNSCKIRNGDNKTHEILRGLQKKYEQMDEKFRNDEEFRIFLKQAFQKVSSGHHDVYSLIDDVHNEIKSRPKRPDGPIVEFSNSNHGSEKKDLNAEENLDTHSEDQQNHEDELSDADKNRVEQLEQAIFKVKEKIKELEEQEVNFSDDEDSAYITLDKYQRKLIELTNLLGDIVNDKTIKREIFKKKLKRSDIPGEMTGILSLDENIIDLVNNNIKKINRLKHIKKLTANPDYLKVPDYAVVSKIVEKYNKENNLNLSQQKIRDIGKYKLSCHLLITDDEVLIKIICFTAKPAFESLAKYLKEKRASESEEFISSFIAVGSEVDLATEDPKLFEEFKKYEQEDEEKLKEIFQKHTKKQLGLSAEELKKAEIDSDCPEDSDDDENSKDKEKDDGNMDPSSSEKIESKSEICDKNTDNDKIEEKNVNTGKQNI